MLRAIKAGIIEIIAFFIPIIQGVMLRVGPKRAAEVRELNEWDGQKHRFILIYVGYSRAIDNFASDYIDSFKVAGAYVIFVTNHPKFDGSMINSSLMDVFINNRDRGWDFAQYKTASIYVARKFENNIPKKIIYANDSVFFLNRRSSYHVDSLLDEEYDFVGAFELSGVGRHSPWQLSSWLFSASRELFVSKDFQEFWLGHAPIKNKRHAIRNGEHKLTAAALSFSGKVKAIYSNDYILSVLEDCFDRIGAQGAIDLVSTVMLDSFERRFDLPCHDSDFYLFVKRNIFSYSPLHMFVLLLLSETDFPFVKKDLFWFNNITYDKLGRLEEIICRISGSDNAREIIRYFLRRGRISEVALKTRLLIQLGLR